MLSRKEAEYTEQARLAGVNATVLVGVTVGADGVLQNLKLIRGAGCGLDESATRNLTRVALSASHKKWPAGGIPIAADGQYLPH